MNQNNMWTKIYNWIESIREKRFYKSLNDVEHRLMQIELRQNALEREYADHEFIMLSE